MEHKVGDRVRVHTLEWFKRNCAELDIGIYYVAKCKMIFNKSKSIFCGKVVTIKAITFDDCYKIAEDNLCYEDWMFEEEAVKEETNWEHYQQEIGEFIKTGKCINCPANESCGASFSTACGFIFANWAMCKYVPEEPIAPHPVYRAWTKDTFPLHIGAEVKEKGGEVVVGVTSYHKAREKVWLDDGPADMTFSELFANYEMADGTPCGELVSGEETK